jgi:predicted O-methyltransferase YrrM
MTLDEHLKARGFLDIIEGYSQQIPNQVYDLKRLISDPKVKTAMEIGFNAGHSADVFLGANPSLHLTSFDLGAHEYVTAAKEYIDKTYPSRHTLILGDSTTTIPAHKQTTYDLIFIDGGHEYEIAKADLLNCRRFADENTIVIMDDTMFMNERGWLAPFNVGPSRAWLGGIDFDVIVELERHHYRPFRGMAWGKYCFQQSKVLSLQ